MKVDIPLKENDIVPLSKRTGWRESAHLFERLDVLAIKAALASERPLLVRGEPGSGKTQLARAVAQQLGWALVYKVINGLTELEELFWRYDAVDRLGEAQVLASEPPKVRMENLHHRKFLTPGPIWWAFDWRSAQHQFTEFSRRKQGRPEWNSEKPPPGVVLLIDEIDKADLDLPNGLLEAFGQGSFQIPWLEEGTVTQSKMPLLTVITTNEERELPRAFLRRCLVRQLEYPSEENAMEFCTWMRKRGRIHFTEDACSDRVLNEAAELIRMDRRGTEYGAIRPGLAEFIDLIRVVTELYEGEHDKQLQALNEVSQFVRRKQGKVF